MKNLTAKEKAILTYAALKKQKIKKIKENESAVFDVVGRAVKRCGGMRK